MESIKKWIVAQTEVAKIAWTIIIVIAGLYGYSTKLTPIERGINTQQTLEQRISLIENEMKTNPNTSQSAASKVLEIEQQLLELKKLIESEPTVTTKKATTVYPYTVPAPKIK